MQALVTSLAAHAAGELPSELIVLWPGMTLDTDGLSEWVEVWCDAVDGLAQRDRPPEQRDVTATVHVFVRPSSNTARVQAVAELVRGAFSGRVIAVQDGSTSPAEKIGVLRTREADVRDLTRLHAEEQRRPLRHVVVLVRGVVQSV